MELTRATTFPLACAVRDGDCASPAPEPDFYVIMIIGLGMLGFISRRRKNEKNKV